MMRNVMRAIIEKEEGKVGDEGRMKKNSPLLLMPAHAKDNSSCTCMHGGGKDMISSSPLHAHACMGEGRKEEREKK